MNKLIVLNPIVTEKTMILAKANTYTFKVDISANKNEIAKTIESIYKVKVADVNIIKEKGKIKRTGKKFGRTSDTKKAYITLEKGQKLKEFEIEEESKDKKKAAKESQTDKKSDKKSEK